MSQVLIHVSQIGCPDSKDSYLIVVFSINRAQAICGGSVVLWLSGLCVGVQVCGRVRYRIVFGYRVYVFFLVKGEV